MVGIYAIKNTVNGKMYIGQSINIDKRIKEHFWKAFCEKDCSFDCILHVAIRKYGRDAFEQQVLEECDESSLDMLERYYIKKYNTMSPNGYNIRPGGQKYHCENDHRYDVCQMCGCYITKGAHYCQSCLS